MSAAFNHHECLEWLLQLPWTSIIRCFTPSVWADAVEHKCLRRLIAYFDELCIRKRWDGRVIVNVIFLDPDLFQFCVDSGAPIDAQTYLTVAKYGDVEEMKRIEEMKSMEYCRLDGGTICSVLHNASGQEDTAMLRYLHEVRGYQLPSTATYYECGGINNMACVAYLVAKGVGLSKRFLFDTIMANDARSFRWALEHGATTLYHQSLLPQSMRIDHASTSQTMLLYLMFSEIGGWGFLEDDGLHMLDVVAELFPLKELTHEDWALLGRLPEYKRKLIHRYVHPRALNVLRWMLKVRPYAWHWIEEHQQAICKEGGSGRARDREEFEENFIHDAKRQRPHGE